MFACVCVRVPVCETQPLAPGLARLSGCTYSNLSLFFIILLFVRWVFCPEDWCPVNAKETKTIARRWELKSDALPKPGYFHFTSWAPQSKWRAFNHSLICCQINRFVFFFFFFTNMVLQLSYVELTVNICPLDKSSLPHPLPTYSSNLWEGRQCKWHNCEQIRKSLFRGKSFSLMVQQMRRHWLRCLLPLLSSPHISHSHTQTSTVHKHTHTHTLL